MEQSSLLRTSALIGLSSSIWLSGVSVSASQLTLPSLYSIPTSASSVVFDGIYHRGIAVVVPFTLISTLGFGLAAYLDPERRTGYALAATVSLAPLPWTAIMMAGINNKLVAIARDEAVRALYKDAAIVDMLKQWRWMNFVRAGLYMTGGVIGISVSDLL